MRLSEILAIKGGHDGGRYFVKDGENRRYLQYLLVDQDCRPVIIDKIYFDPERHYNQPPRIYQLETWYTTRYDEEYKFLFIKSMSVNGHGRPTLTVEHTINRDDIQDEINLPIEEIDEHNKQVQLQKEFDKKLNQKIALEKEIFELQKKKRQLESELISQSPIEAN